MEWRKRFLECLVGSLFLLASCQGNEQKLSLAGDWRFSLDPQDVGIAEGWSKTTLAETLCLPGSLQEQGKGEDISVNTQWTGQIVDNSWYAAPEYAPYREPGNVKVPFWLSPEKHYVGVAWYQRTVTIPTDWENRPVILNLERTHWGTTLFVDGERVDERNSLQTPHRYVLNGLKAGERTVTLRVDNRMLVNVGNNAHSVSDHTQSNWNGVIGDISLSVKPNLYLGAVQIYPDIVKKQAKVRVQLQGKQEGEAKLSLKAETPTGKRLGTPVVLSVDSAKVEWVETVVDLGEKAELWSEHTPNFYRMNVELKTADGIDQAGYDFGLREFKTNGTRFEINGAPTFLRGTLECCIFPKTGYPAMQNDYWAKIFKTCKSYGINHIRFHSWCPPEVAFHVADSVGMYLQVECGAWTNVGDGEPQDLWLKEESLRILQEYGNHPSFCMMAYGNEPVGQNQGAYLSGLVELWKNVDSRRVYTTGAGWPYVENADYWSAFEPRIQLWGAGLNSVINGESPRSDYDFADRIRKDMPTVSHEIGQWCVYPNFKEIEKYTGVLKAKNFEIFQEMLSKNGMADMSEKFLYASGRLQTLCYKADIEAALRTPGFAGFQLLDLHDFPGQGTALVGVLDAFWDDKGYVTGEEYCTFCNTTVPLVRLPKMIWLNTETLKAPIEVAHFGERPLSDAKVTWSLMTADKQIVGQGTHTCDLPQTNCIPAGSIRCDLSKIDSPSQLTLSVQIDDANAHNQWNIWVYPTEKKTLSASPYVTTVMNEETLARLNNGESVLLLTYGNVPADKGGNVQVGFSSIFWNTAWTGKQAPHTLGICCDSAHPALAAFPNNGVSDYQWWDLMNRCNAMDLSDFSKDFHPIVNIIDDWFTNRKLALLYEGRVGKGKIVVCSADLQNDLEQRPAAAQFRQSLLEYMASDVFNPTEELPVENLLYVQK